MLHSPPTPTSGAARYSAGGATVDSQGYENDDINFIDPSPAMSLDGESQLAQYLACADDRGGILVYNYPTVVNEQR